MAKLLKRLVARSLEEALQRTKEYGKDQHNMSVERIADRIGSNTSNLYKYLSDATMPINKLIAFEESCGILLVTQYLAHSHNCLLVPIPTGRKATSKETNELQKQCNNVIGLLIDLYDGNSQPDTVVSALNLIMQDFAFHRHNAEKQHQPELMLFGEER